MMQALVVAASAIVAMAETGHAAQQRNESQRKLACLDAAYPREGTAALYQELVRIGRRSTVFEWRGGCSEKDLDAAAVRVVALNVTLRFAFDPEKDHQVEEKRGFYRAAGERPVVGVVHSEKCVRESYFYDFPVATTYPAPCDAGTAALQLPVGRTAAFVRAEETAAPVSVSDAPTYLFNMVVPLHVGNRARSDWNATATAFRDDLENRGGKLRAFVRNSRRRARVEESALEKVKNEVSTAERLAVVQSSAFTLVPPGRNWESHRLWEAMSQGSIPVVARGWSAERLGDPPATKLDSLVRTRSIGCGEAHEAKFASAPVLWVDADDLASAWPAMVALASDPAALAARRADVRRWYDDAMETAFLRLEALAAGATAKAGGIPLITGAAHAGTHAFAHLLNSNGVNCVHEGAESGAVSSSWIYAGHGKTTVPYPFEHDGQVLGKRSFSAVVHVVREPTTHVRALAAGVTGSGDLVSHPNSRSADRISYEFAGSICPRVRAAYAEVGSGEKGNLQWRGANASKWDDGRLRVAALYHLDWNAVAATAGPVVVRLRIENLDEYALFAGLGIAARTTWPLKHTLASLASVEHHSKSHNARLTWGDLAHALPDALTDELRARAAAYGYDSGSDT